VPDENPTGDYRLTLSLPRDWPPGRTLLRFEGVDSCARVHVNGVHVGTTTGSRLPVELDVTDVLRPGDNLLAARVHQWSAASYLEDQDMWWLSGILRTVTLVSRPPGSLRDLFVHAGFDHLTGAGRLRVDATAEDGCEVRVRGPSTTSTTTAVRTSTSTAGCTPPTPRWTRSGGGRSRRCPTHSPTRTAAAFRSCSASTDTRWATGRGLAEYQRLFEEHHRCAGGFVWERIDHGLRSRTPDGVEFYAYGGDFGEPLHDGAFIADGLLFPDRTPSPGLHELAAVSAPVRLVVGQSGVEVRNRYQFRDLSHVTLPWVLEDDGVEVISGTLAVPEIAPGAMGIVALPVLPTSVTAGQRWLTIRAVLAVDQPWAPAGTQLGIGQRRVTARLLPPVTAAHLPGAVPRATADSGFTVGAAAFDTGGRLERVGGSTSSALRSSTCGGPRPTTTASVR